MVERNCLIGLFLNLGFTKCINELLSAPKTPTHENSREPGIWKLEFTNLP